MPAFWPGSQFDRQSREAIIANDKGQYSGVLPQLLSKDAFFGALGEVLRDFPNPSFAVLKQQAYVAIRANTTSETAGVLPQFLAKDQFYDGPGKAPAFDFPNPSFAVVARQAAIAARAGHDDQANTPIPLEIGPLQEFPPGAAAYDLAPRGPARATADVYTIGEAFPQVLIGQDALAVGDQSFVLPTPAVLRARDYTIAASFPLELIGKDSMAAGAQLSGNAPATAQRAASLVEPGVNFAIQLSAAAPQIPPGEASLDQQYRTPPRAREYGQTSAFFHGLDGQDAMAAGAQLSGNAPAGARRAVDYTWLYTPLPLLFGQDQLAAGAAAFDLPAKAPARARDYSFSASYFQGLIGQDALAVGDQLSGNAPAGPLRAATLSDPGSNPIPLLTSVAPPFIQTTAPCELPPRGAARARDYSFSASYFQGLIAQDAMLVGDQISGNAPAGAPRASTLSEPGVNLTILLTAAPPVIPYGLSTALSELYPRAAARARDYSFSASYFQGLIGKDAFPNGSGGQVQEDWPNPSFAVPLAQSRVARTAADVGQFDTPLPIFVGLDQFPNGIGGQVQDEWPNPMRGAPRSFAVYDPGVNNTALAPTVPPPPGAQSFDLPAKAAPRARDYSFSAWYFQGLIGKDALPVGDSTGTSELPPKAPARARDYTWLQTAPLYVFQQLPPGESTESSVLPPRGPARARDYTFLKSLPIHLIGQERLYGAPGEVPAYDWQLPPRAAPRARDYTHSATAPYGSGIPPRDLLYLAGVPFANWVVGAIAPDVHWVIGPPQPEVNTGAPQQ